MYKLMKVKHYIYLVKNKLTGLYTGDRLELGRPGQITSGGGITRAGGHIGGCIPLKKNK